MKYEITQQGHILLLIFAGVKPTTGGGGVAIIYTDILISQVINTTTSLPLMRCKTSENERPCAQIHVQPCPHINIQ